MKGTLQIAVILVALNSLVLTLWSGAAAPPAPVPAAKATRVAILNLTYVIKNYDKFKTYQDDLRKTIQPYQDRDAKIKAAGEALAKEAKDEDTTADRHGAIERELKQLQREVENNKEEARRVLVKKQEDQLKTLYLDIEKASRRLARKRGFDLILHYNDAITSAERYSSQNIARKMQAAPLMPLYSEPGVDVSQEVLDDLHKALKLDRL